MKSYRTFLFLFTALMGCDSAARHEDPDSTGSDELIALDAGTRTADADVCVRSNGTSVTWQALDEASLAWDDPQDPYVYDPNDFTGLPAEIAPADLSPEPYAPTGLPALNPFMAKKGTWHCWVSPSGVCNKNCQTTIKAVYSGFSNEEKRHRKAIRQKCEGKCEKDQADCFNCVCKHDGCRFRS